MIVLAPLRRGRPALESVFSGGVRVAPSRVSSSVTLPIGQSFYIESTFYGFPSPRVDWFFNGQPIVESGEISIETLTVGEKTTSRLTLSNPSAETNSGSYLARSGDIEDAVEIVLSEEGNPVINRQVPLADTITANLHETTIGRSIVYAAPGATVRVRCTATGKPAATISWLFDDKTVSATGRQKSLPDGILEVEGVTRAETYTCMAVNSRGEDTEEITLRPAGK